MELNHNHQPVVKKIHGWLESDDDGDEGRDWRSRFI
jgi:hypothetical protein